MLGFLKRRMRKEHLRLVSENRRMAAQICRLASLSIETMGDLQAIAIREAMDEKIGRLDELAAVLDRKDVLDVDDVSEMLQLNRVLNSEVANIERGRAAFHQRFSKQ